MRGAIDEGNHTGRSLLGRLRHDVRANALAIMAVALIPLSALAGSAIDMARIYVVKVRLQQACDAGALAGRKFMTSSASTTLDATATTQANTFFSNNFQTGWMNTTAVSFTPSKTTDQQVAGIARATVPMTLMKMFSAAPVRLAVNCEARFDVADTDVVFVLDTTGSMACLPADLDAVCTAYVNSVVQSNTMNQYTRPADSALGAASGVTGSSNDSVAGYPGSTAYAVPEKSGSRIAALRTAVANFYSTLATSADPTTHIRYGFVPYTSTVNAGAAIMDMNSAYMIGGSGTTGGKTWTYQSRFVSNQYQVSQTSAYDSTSQANCNTSVRTPAATTGQPYTFNTSSLAVVVGKAWNSSQSGSNKCQVTTTTYGPIWTYGPSTYDVSAYLTNATVDDPSKLDGTTNSWSGCIEERDTEAGVTSFTSASKDLDPDLIPSDDSSRWRPLWAEVIYGRNYNPNTGAFTSTSNVVGTASQSGDTDKTAYYGSSLNREFSYFYYSGAQYMKGGFISCGKPIRRIATMTQQDVTNYVNATDFKAVGGTYHDTGMIWGTRMLSPNGIFANDTAAWPGRQPPNRVIVFLTDGDMSPSQVVYGQYGVEYFDKRVTGGTYANQKAYHNARFLAECAKAKAMNISVWTVSIAPAATTEMQQCATTTTQALYTTSGSDLSDKFAAIAKAIAMLRISK